MMKSMFKTTHTIIASSGVYSGTGMSKSPKTAHRLATNQAWDKLMEGDRKHGCCSGIAGEDTVLFRDGKFVSRNLDL